MPVFFVGQNVEVKFQVIENPLEKELSEFYIYDLRYPNSLIEQSDYVTKNVLMKECTIMAGSKNLGINTIVVKYSLKLRVEELVQEKEYEKKYMDSS